MDNKTIGRDALEFIDSLLTPEEIEESNLLVMEMMKDEYDLKVYEEALIEYKNNPKTYSHREVCEMFGDSLMTGDTNACNNDIDEE